jgi:hypothetical protein
MGGWRLLIRLHVEAAFLHGVHIRRGHVKKLATVTELPFRSPEFEDNV